MTKYAYTANITETAPVPVARTGLSLPVNPSRWAGRNVNITDRWTPAERESAGLYAYEPVATPKGGAVRNRVVTIVEGRPIESATVLTADKLQTEQAEALAGRIAAIQEPLHILMSALSAYGMYALPETWEATMSQAKAAGMGPETALEMYVLWNETLGTHEDDIRQWLAGQTQEDAT